MAKKIYDIFPPGTIKEEKPFTREKKKKTGKKIKKLNLNFKGLAILFGLVFFLFLITSHTIFLNAETVIWPETETITYAGEVKIDSSLNQFNDDMRAIPGEFFEMKEGESRTFFSSGKETEERKAEGILRVYNNHSSLPQTLVANTRFVSADGKLFYSNERISVPGRRQEGNRTIPGEMEVLVIAAEPGRDYNIEKQSKFSIPGLQGTPMYISVYAENPDPITGGHIGELPQITENDVESAQQVLIEDILEKSKKKLKEEISDDFVIESNLIGYEIIEKSVYPGVGENKDSFDLSIQLELKVLSYKKSELINAVEKFLLAELENNLEQNNIFGLKKIYKESLEINTRNKFVDLENGKAELDIGSLAITYFEIKEDVLKREIEGKSIQEIKKLENYEKIDKIEFNYWPFWINKIPSYDKIKITIKIEN